eukprot:Nk52_evm40s232 gene=Nk52_evmTU40s232
MLIFVKLCLLMQVLMTFTLPGDAFVIGRHAHSNGTTRATTERSHFEVVKDEASCVSLGHQWQMCTPGQILRLSTMSNIYSKLPPTCTYAGIRSSDKESISSCVFYDPKGGVGLGFRRRDQSSNVYCCNENDISETIVISSSSDTFDKASNLCEREGRQLCSKVDIFKTTGLLAIDFDEQLWVSRAEWLVNEQSSTTSLYETYNGLLYTSTVKHRALCCDYATTQHMTAPSVISKVQQGTVKPKYSVAVNISEGKKWRTLSDSLYGFTFYDTYVYALPLSDDTKTQAPFNSPNAIASLNKKGKKLVLMDPHHATNYSA